LVLAIDTSCSLTDVELAEIEVHVNEIVEVIEPNIVHVVYCDTTVKHSDTFDRGDYVKLKFHGGGGTRFNPPFNWVVHNDIEPDALIYFTDGGGSVGPRGLNDPFEVPSYPVIWATNWQDPNFLCEEFGEIVKI
jgi:predicted metal-dependent peptidase